MKDKYKDYFNKKVIRYMALSIFVLVAITFLSSANSLYLECPKESNTPCINPLYDCKYNPNINNANFCNKIKDVECKDNLCEVQYLQQGEFLGEQPKHLQTFMPNYIVLIMIISFIINHIIYTKKQRGKNEKN